MGLSRKVKSGIFSTKAFSLVFRDNPSIQKDKPYLLFSSDTSHKNKFYLTVKLKVSLNQIRRSTFQKNGSTLLPAKTGAFIAFLNVLKTNPHLH